MPKPLSDALRVGPLETADQAKAWIKALHENSQMYHFDDDPEGQFEISTEEPTFLPEDLPTVRARVAELFDFSFCPFEYAIELMCVDAGHIEFSDGSCMCGAKKERPDG